MFNKKPLLRFSLGDADTTTRAEMKDVKFRRFIQMAKMSI